MAKMPLVGALVVAAAVLVSAQGVEGTRVYDTRSGRFVDIDGMVEELAKAHVVFVGEQHNDVNTHRVELALLQAIASRRGNVILALEMFERDVQDPLDHFLLEHSTEDEFLAASRPWPEYRRDYKPLVDFAITKQWYVVAANVPRRIASAVAEQGMASLQEQPASERLFFPADVPCPVGDEYHRRFLDAMGGGHAEGGGAPMSAKAMEGYYQSQCLKDETMAESIAQAFAAGAIGGTPPLVVVVNGAFHSDYGLGTVARVRRRLSERRVVVTSILPVGDATRVVPSADARRRANYLIYSPR